MQCAPTEIDRLVQIVDILRERCAWTAGLSHESLRTYLLEESYEVLDAIAENDPDLLREELGDLLFQILLHSAIAAEHEQFSLEEVAATLSAKLLRRNRHVFDQAGQVREKITDDIEQIIEIWDAAKRAERSEAGQAERPHAGLPAGLPALALSQKLLSRQRRAGKAAPEGPSAAELRLTITDERSLAEALLGLTARASELGLDAESVLRDALRSRG